MKIDVTGLDNFEKKLNKISKNAKELNGDVELKFDMSQEDFDKLTEIERERLVNEQIAEKLFKGVK